MSVVSALGLPGGVRACLFEPDGALAGTAELQAAAWLPEQS
jgi:hypothetical protein